MKTLISCLVSLILLGLVGCSGGVGIPSTPDAVTENTCANNDAAHQLWGLWQFKIDPVEYALDTYELRTGNLHLNALPFLEPPVLLYLTVESLEFNGNVINCEIGLRHPFLGLNKFTGFDVKGILIGSGSETIDELPALRYAGENDLRLLNPDGYTRWWNPAEFPNDGTISGYTDGLLGTPDSVADFSATLNPYKYYCDDMSNSDDPLDVIDINGRGVFSAGQKNVRRFIIDFSQSDLIFNYAVDASWRFPTGNPPWEVPDDFPEDANQPEPYRISVHEIDNTLAYNPSTGVSWGEIQIEVAVFDWFDAGENILSGYSANGELTSASSGTPIGGGEGYSTYAIDLSSQDITSADDILLWLAVECALPNGYGGILPGEAQGMYFPYIVEVDDSILNECGALVHNYEGSYPISGVPLNDLVWTSDMAMQEVGPFAGKAVIQTEPDVFSAVDITGSNIGNAVYYFTYAGSHTYYSMDCCSFSGRIALADLNDNNFIEMFDVDGNHLGTYDTGSIEVVCLDFDDNGDIWYVGYSGTTPQLMHLTYTDNSPYYNEAPTDTLSILPQFSPGSYWTFGDIAIDYEDDKAYVLGCMDCVEHYLAVYDISGPPMFIGGRDDVFSGTVDIVSAYSTKYARRLDIEIDHSLADYCHILTSAHIKEGSQYYHELVKLEVLTTVDVYTGDPQSSYQTLPSQIVISPVSPHNLVTTPQYLGSVDLFTCDDW